MNLQNENIAKTVEDIQNFFRKAKVSERDVTKICLVIEEALIRWQERFGENHELKIYKKSWFGSSKVIIRLIGEPFNPLQSENNDETIFSTEIIKNLLHLDDAKTIYRYENGYNELISFSPKERKLPKIPGGAITVAIVLAIICAFLDDFLTPEVRNILFTEIVTPTLSALMSLIVTVTVFMIFFSITSSICAMEDSTTLGNIGVTVIRRFFLIDLCIIALTMIISVIFFPMGLISGEGSLEVGKIVELFLSIVPTNVLDAFLKGNVLQVMVMAFLIGICVTILGNRITNVKILLIELNTLMFKIMQVALKVIPLVIFLCIFKTLSTNDFSNIFAVWKLIIAGLIAYVISIALMLIWLRIKTKMAIPDFLRKIFPAFIIAFTTGSSAASLPESLEVSKENLRIEEKFCNFWVPLSLVLFSPSKLIQLTMAGFYVMAISGNGISIFELFIVTFLAIQLSISTPNAAGGIVASFSILLTQLGLPLEHIGSLMIADVITGNLFTALNVLIRESEIVLVAKKMNFIKTD